jgi:hypothetical protein
MQSFQHAGANCNCEQSGDLPSKFVDGSIWLQPRKLSEWARQDSNLGPRDYESPALTAELQARFLFKLNHANR